MKSANTCNINGKIKNHNDMTDTYWLSLQIDGHLIRTNIVSERYIPPYNLDKLNLTEIKQLKLQLALKNQSAKHNYTDVIKILNWVIDEHWGWKATENVLYENSLVDKPEFKKEPKP
eukprot:UN29581